MCGIAGVVTTKNINEELSFLRRGVTKLSHRGPDEETFWINERNTTAFGHRRLCIIDLTNAASQPMHYAGRYTVIHNGELYNYLEIRTELEKGGYSFRSNSDTEVLLAAYAAWGADCLQRFDGMFAFAIWDEEEQRLFAARDRFGEKPFFFFYDEKKLVFVSEIKALWEMGIKKEANQSMVYNFLTIGYTSNPSDNTETFYNNIHKLPAAHCLTYSPAENKLNIWPYWQVYIETDNGISEGDAIAGFQDLFKQSIRKRLRSDVAIGTSLSGGLDSSSIVAFCADETAEQYTHKCFTASFAGFEKDETQYAVQVAKTFNLQHYTTTVTEDRVAELMDTIVAQQDEPFSSSSALAQYCVFELAKQQGVTVLLDGQGADEILGGYHKYYRWYWAELYRSGELKKRGELSAAKNLGVSERFGLKNKIAASLPEFSASILQSGKTTKAFRHMDLNRDFAYANKRNLYYTTPTQPGLNGALHYNTFVNGLEEILRLADRNSMAHSLEVRLPFLERRLVEFLFTLPPHYKIHNGWTKWLLRKSVEHKLPAEIVWRKDKTGYEPPQKQWMNNSAVQKKIMEARQTLVDENILAPHVLNKSIVPKAAHEQESYDWRYWSAAQLFLENKDNHR